MQLTLNRGFKIALVIAGALSLAATTLEKGQLIELQSFVNARSEAKFRTTDDNKVYELKKGTKAFISATEPIKSFGNGAYGLCLQLINAEVSNKRNCYWVYYSESRSNIKVFDLKGSERETLLKEWANDSTKTPAKVLDPAFASQATKTPAPGHPALVTAPTKAVVENHPTPEKKPDQKPKVTPPAVQASAPATKASAPAPKAEKQKETAQAQAGAESAIHGAVTKVVEVNQSLSSAINPAPQTEDCPYCVKTITKYETCSEKNNYLQKEMSFLEQTDPNNAVSALLKMRKDASYVKDTCFQSSLMSFGGPYKYCKPGETGAPVTSVQRACVEAKYTTLIRNSFDATGDCLGEYLTGHPATVKASMVELFGLMSVESGLHINARSEIFYCTAKDVAAERKCKNVGDSKAGGAGGVGQLTQGAIEAINKHELRLMRMHLDEKANDLNNPNRMTCKLLRDQLDKPMEDNLHKSCDRISLSKGNPLKNLMYTIAHQKSQRNAIELNRMSQGPYARIFGSLNAELKDYLVRQLAIWEHNSGQKPLNAALQEYARNYLGQPLKSKSDVDLFLHNMRPFMRKHITDRMNPDEPVNFWIRIKKRIDDLDKNAGGGSCAVGQN